MIKLTCKRCGEEFTKREKERPATFKKRVFCSQKCSYKSRLINITGQKFGRLTVGAFIGIDKNRASLWLCRCSCGKQVIIKGNSLITDHTKSCGCFMREVNGQRMKDTLTTHAMASAKSRHPLYKKWGSMLTRCRNPKDHNFKKYGGRGIQVCERWLKFENFRDDMLQSYTEHAKVFGASDTTIERLSPNGNYEPKNCRWATKREQAMNKRNTIFLEYLGQKQGLSEWARTFNIKPHTLMARIDMGWSVEKALTQKVK